MQTKAIRRSNLELLRIIAMLFIVAHHFGVHGKYGDMEMSALNSFIVDLFSAGGKLGVNIYVLISGYFLIRSDFKPRRIINTWSLTAFYSIAIYLLLLAVQPGFEFTVGGFLRSIFVVAENQYWFVTRYVSLLILSPFLNKLIHAIDERGHLLFIAVLMFLQIEFPGTSSYISLSETGWFILLYTVAAYLRLYPKRIFENKPILVTVSIIFCTVLGIWRHSTGMLNAFCLIPSLSLFCLFNCLEIKHSRFINLISRTTFAVYLIHDNIHVREYIWGVWNNCPFHATLDGFWLFAAVSVLAAFVGCSLIDLVRIILIKPLAPHIDRLNDKIESTISAISDRIRRLCGCL